MAWLALPKNEAISGANFGQKMLIVPAAPAHFRDRIKDDLHGRDFLLAIHDNLGRIYQVGPPRAARTTRRNMQMTEVRASRTTIPAAWPQMYRPLMRG